jgi:hypothetical protein
MIENVMYALLLSGLMKLLYSPHIYKKYSAIKFNINPSIGGRVVPCGPKGRQTNGQA